MGYRIVYGKQEKWKFPKKKTLLLVFAAMAMVVMLWPAGRNALREWMLPGDTEVTSQALQGLAADLSDGESLGDAVTAFCKEIIQGGQ